MTIIYTYLLDKPYHSIPTLVLLLKWAPLFIFFGVSRYPSLSAFDPIATACLSALNFDLL